MPGCFETIEAIYMKERLLEYLKYRQLGQNAFEDSCGISQGTINKLNHGIRSDKLALIAKACPDLNLRWLLLGEGSMVLENSNDKESSENHDKIPSVNVIGSAQAVFIANWSGIEPVMEKVVAKILGGK